MLRLWITSQLCSELPMQAAVARLDEGCSYGDGRKPSAKKQKPRPLEPSSERVCLTAQPSVLSPQVVGMPLT